MSIFKYFRKAIENKKGRGRKWKTSERVNGFIIRQVMKNRRISPKKFSAKVNIALMFQDRLSGVVLD